MPSKWIAYALLKAEKGFRRINGYAELKKLAKILQSFSPPPPEEGEHGVFIWIQYRRIIMEKGLFEFAAISSTNPGRVG